MSDEFNALLHNGTWDLVPPSSSTNLVGCKWVFRIKRNSDGAVDHYKARLVAKGTSNRALIIKKLSVLSSSPQQSELFLALLLPITSHFAN